MALKLAPLAHYTPRLSSLAYYPRLRNETEMRGFEAPSKCVQRIGTSDCTRNGPSLVFQTLGEGLGNPISRTTSPIRECRGGHSRSALGPRQVLTERLRVSQPVDSRLQGSLPLWVAKVN